MSSQQVSVPKLLSSRCIMLILCPHYVKYFEIMFWHIIGHADLHTVGQSVAC